MLITKQQLAAVFKQASPERIDRFIQPINQTIAKYEINTPQRVRMFLAQVGHESGELRYVKELASGKAYEGRKDLGNVIAGDGVRYKGRGLIQITGRANYASVSAALGQNFVLTPELLEDPLYAAISAGWYWNSRSLNTLADAGQFDLITRKINGGLNGLADRKRLYNLAFEVIK